MKKKPFSFYVLSMFFLSVALTIPLQVLYLMDYRIDEVSKTFDKITYLNYAIILSCVLNAYLSVRTNPYLKYSLVCSVVLVGINNFIVSSIGSDFSGLQTSIASICFALVPLFLLMNKGFFVLDNPNKCFWIPAKRLSSDDAVLLKGNLGVYLRANGVNISKTGMLVSLRSDDKGSLKVGESVSLEFLFLKSQNLMCRAKVVRKDSDKNEGTQELALQFDDFSIRRSLLLLKRSMVPEYSHADHG